jgi:hypothetical protein
MRDIFVTAGVRSQEPGVRRKEKSVDVACGLLILDSEF